MCVCGSLLLYWRSSCGTECRCLCQLLVETRRTGLTGRHRLWQMLVSCKGLQAKYIIRGLQGKMRVGLTDTTVMGETGSLSSNRLIVSLCQRTVVLCRLPACFFMYYLLKNDARWSFECRR